MKQVLFTFLVATALVSVAFSQEVLESRKDNLERETYLKVDKQNGGGEVEEVQTEYHGDSLQARRKIRRTYDPTGKVLKEISEVFDSDGKILRRREVRWDLSGTMTYGENKEWIYPPSGRELEKDQFYDREQQAWKDRDNELENSSLSGSSDPAGDRFGLVGFWEDAHGFQIEIVQKGETYEAYIRKVGLINERSFGGGYKAGQQFWRGVKFNGFLKKYDYEKKQDVSTGIPRFLGECADGPPWAGRPANWVAYAFTIKENEIHWAERCQTSKAYTVDLTRISR